MADCKEVAIVSTWGFVSASSTYACDGYPAYVAEQLQFADYLADLSLSARTFADTGSTGVTWSEVRYYPIIVYSNGGWSAAGAATTLALLQTAEAEGRHLFFLGDDVGRHATAMTTAWGVSDLLDMAHIATWTSNGTTAGATVLATGHEVVDGPWGTVSSFDYYHDIDVVTLTGAGETELMQIDGTTSPAAWVAKEGDQRTAVLLAAPWCSVSSPPSDTAGLESMEAFFKNAVWWLGGW